MSPPAAFRTALQLRTVHSEKFGMYNFTGIFRVTSICSNVALISCGIRLFFFSLQLCLHHKFVSFLCLCIHVISYIATQCMHNFWCCLVHGRSATVQFNHLYCVLSIRETSILHNKPLMLVLMKWEKDS